MACKRPGVRVPSAPPRSIRVSAPFEAPFGRCRKGVYRLVTNASRHRHSVCLYSRPVEPNIRPCRRVPSSTPSSRRPRALTVPSQGHGRYGSLGSVCSPGISRNSRLIMNTYTHRTRHLPLVVFAFVLASCSGTEQQGASLTPGASVVETTADTLSDAVDNLDDLYTSLGNADVEFLEGVADDSSTPVEVLAKLANHEDMDVRSGVARHPSTPVVMLTKLADDEDVHVRSGVAGNPSTSGEVLAKLANDAVTSVRWTVAKNPSTSGEVLAKLANDAEISVRNAARRRVQ